MKIVDESILFFSLKIPSENSLHFVGIRVFIVGCMRNVKGQVSNKQEIGRASCRERVYLAV